MKPLKERDIIFYFKGFFDNELPKEFTETQRKNFLAILASAEETTFTKLLKSALVSPKAFKTIIEDYSLELMKEQPSIFEKSSESFKGLFSTIFSN